MKLLDNRHGRFEEKQFIFVHSLADATSQPRIGPVRIVSMCEAHVSNRAERLKLFGLLDHLDTTQPSPKRSVVAGKVRPSSEQFLDLGDAARVACLVPDAAERGDRRCFQRFRYDVEGGIDLLSLTFSISDASKAVAA